MKGRLGSLKFSGLRHVGEDEGEVTFLAHLLTTDKAHSILIGYVDQEERTVKLPEKEYK